MANIQQINMMSDQWLMHCEINAGGVITLPQVHQVKTASEFDELKARLLQI